MKLDSSRIETPYVAGAVMVVIGVPLLFGFDIDSVVLLPIYATTASLITLWRRRAFAARGVETLMGSRTVQAILVLQAVVLGIALVALREDLQPIVAGAFVFSWVALAFYQASFFAAVDAGEA